MAASMLGWPRVRSRRFNICRKSSRPPTPYGQCRSVDRGRHALWGSWGLLASSASVAVMPSPTPDEEGLIGLKAASASGRKRTCRRQTTQSRMLESALEPKRTFASFRHGRHPKVQWFNYLVFLGLNDRSALSIVWLPDPGGLLRIICHMSDLRLGG